MRRKSRHTINLDLLLIGLVLLFVTLLRMSGDSGNLWFLAGAVATWVTIGILLLALIGELHSKKPVVLIAVLIGGFALIVAAAVFS